MSTRQGLYPTRETLKRDYWTVDEIARDWRVHPDTVRRWIRKGYADKSMVETMGGKYYVHKEEVHRWEAAYQAAQKQIGLGGTRLPFRMDVLLNK